MCPQLRVTLLSVFGGVLCLPACALAQTTPLQLQQPTTLAPPPVSATAPLEQLPSSEPTIIYENGLLTISAHKSTLSEILRAIGNQTGADIDIPPHTDELVAVHLGPGPARDVVQSLLAGSRFNYIIVGSNTDSNTLTKILLLPMLAVEKPPQPLVNTAGAQPPSAQRSESNDIEEGVQEPALPVRAQQQMLQQRRQMLMQDFQQNQQPK
jgi:hypothetical protein